MTDRIYALTVVLEQDIRDDDLEPIIAAICQIRRVISVQQHVAGIETHMAEQRAKRELQEKLWEILK